MPTTLLKRVTSPNVYRTKNPVTGKMEVTPVPSDRLKRWAATAKRMLDNGVKIPVPFAHVDDAGKMPHPVILAEGSPAPLDAFTGQPIGWRADLNGGFIGEAFYSPDGSPASFPPGVIPPADYVPQGEGFYATIEAEGDPTDPRTPAWKLLNTVKETSICVRDKYTDGKGNEYAEAPIHVAACTHAREPGQPPFVPLAPPAPHSIASSLHPSLAMSDTPYLLITMAETVANPPANAAPSAAAAGANSGLPGQPPVDLLSQVLEQLRVQAIDLPEDTTPDNLLERLLICLRQKAADDKASADESAPLGPPAGSETKPPAIAMSTAPAPAAVSTPAATLNGVATPPAPADKAAMILMGQVLTGKKDTLLARIEKLVKEGRIGRAFADTSLIPQVTTLSFSLDQMDGAGNFPTSSIETMIAGFESAAAGTPPLTAVMSDGTEGNAPAGSHVPDPPDWATENAGENGEATEAQITEMLDAVEGMV